MRGCETQLKPKHYTSLTPTSLLVVEVDRQFFNSFLCSGVSSATPVYIMASWLCQQFAVDRRPVSIAILSH